jgi:hypothetical protein
VLLVLANVGDYRAQQLQDALPDADARIVTPLDLQRGGWAYRPGRPDGTFQLGSTRVDVAELDAVCVLMPAVYSGDLPQISPEHRAYVAAEMTAFLCAWLADLPCPLLNKPSPACLCGPHWATARWRHVAAAAGLPVTRPHADPHGPAAADSEAVAVTVIGDEAFGSRNPFDVELGLALAARASVRALRVHVERSDGQPRVAGADVWLDTGEIGVAHAIRSALLAQQ